MIDELIKYQQWRTGKIDASLDEIGLTPKKVTACLNWAIESLTNGLAAHDAEVAAKAVESFIAQLEGNSYWNKTVNDVISEGYQYAAKIRAGKDGE